VLSGDRVLSRPLVDVVRIRTGGFEVETEITLQALSKRLAVAEMAVDYAARPPGSSPRSPRPPRCSRSGTVSS
jgi:hypothetical protein